MAYHEIKQCRICAGGNLITVLHLGEQALTGVFPRSCDETIPSGPLDLVKCDEQQGGCGLVQLRHSYTPEEMYGQNYGYRSGLNQSMVRHLQRRVQIARGIARPNRGDLILDIGSNDSTTLQAHGTENELVGMDPTGVKFARYYPEHVKLIPDFFRADTFLKHYPTKRAKIVTSIAMFYDLESPQGFMADIHRVLDNEGIWVFEQSYLPLMLSENAYDTICHEHISYYALRQIHWMTERAGFKILDVELNDANGGSFCITVAKKESRYQANTQRVEELLAQEDAMGLSTLAPFHAFRDRVHKHRDELSRFVKSRVAAGQSVYGYGASTKGNVLLQYCGFTPADIPMIAEVNPDKFGAYTPGTYIPIASEAEVRARRPDYLLVLPWHFRAGIVPRETAYLNQGGRLIFPLPHIDVVETRSTSRVAEAA